MKRYTIIQLGWNTREVLKCRLGYGGYRALTAQALKLGWSPEQIANRLKMEYPNELDMQISHESIYTYLYVLPKGELRKELLSYLRTDRRKRQKRGNTHSILVPLNKKDAPAVRKAFARETKHLPAQMKLSLTYDRGKEMAEHELFTKQTKIQVYFAHPQSPWERGTNENTNGLIKRYFPKGTDFNKFNRKEIKAVQDSLNGRPRKVLGYLTPFEVFDSLLH